MAGSKRRQEEERGMRLNPDNIVVEGADGSARTRRQHCCDISLNTAGLPGSWADIETSRKQAEQERPNGNHRDAGGSSREKIGGTVGKSSLGVGSAHSSDEAWKAAYSGRHSGAKGLTGQGTRGRER